MPIIPEDPGLLYRSPRPGYDPNQKTRQVEEAEVANWCAQAVALEIKAIVCLLDDKQLPLYSSVPNGLLGYYHREHFEVYPHPTADHKPVPEAVLEHVFSNFLNAKKPVLVHCSAGVDRTGKVIEYLIKTGAIPFWKQCERLMLYHSGVGRPESHFRQVTRLAMLLYDGLESKHKLHPRYRTALWAAAILHDIGTDPRLGSDPDSHAWRSADKILKDDIKCPLASSPEIATVASLHSLEGDTQEGTVGKVYERIIARWSPKPIPGELMVLASILRVADGFDRSLDGSVSGLQLQGDTILAQGNGPQFHGNVRRAQKKCALLTELLGVRVADVDPQGGCAPLPVSVKPRPPAPILFLDFLGTIIHHKTKRAMPMLRFMIHWLRASGYRVVVLTSFEKGEAQTMAAKAELDVDLEIHSTQNRGQMVGQILRAAPATERAYYIDDKPEGLESVLRAGLPCLSGRIVGFTGSRRHCETHGATAGMAPWCQTNGVSLALSPYDILCRLQEYEVVEKYVAEKPDLSPEELGLLIPGLAHPFSAVGGAARAVGTFVLANRNDWTAIWKNLGWIGCCECQCKIMIRSALLSLEIDTAAIPGVASKAHEHIAAVNALRSADKRRVGTRLGEIRSLMDVGLRQIGAAAEDCRPPDGEGNWEKNRMQRLDTEFLSKLVNAD